MNIAANILKPQVKEEQNVLLITSSNYFKSLLRRLIILPKGTLLKNLMRLAYRRPLMMLLCTFLPCLTAEKVRISAWKKMKMLADSVRPMKIHK